MKKTKPRTYAYKAVLSKWYYDHFLHEIISTRIFRFVIAKSFSEARKLIENVIKKETKSRGPYMDLVSIAKISKKELIQKQRKRLCRFPNCPFGKRIVF